MTGIERLREFTEARPSLLTCDQIEELRDISAQIAREHAEDCHRMGLDYGTVLSVAADMERHFPCVERGEESDVERWSRELRGALGGRAQGHAADVSMSAYDLLPADEREAIAWVRDHGGLSHVKDILHDFRAVVDRLGVEWSESELHGLMDALDRRLMPEGIEWPRYESGELVGFGDEASRLGEDFRVSVICLYSDDSYARSYALNYRAYSKGERVRRPVVPAADSEPLEVGQTVWDTDAESDTPLTVVEVSSDLIWCEYTWKDGKTYRPCYPPSDLTHQRPVLDADGVPIREGDTVWHIETGREYVVVEPHYGETVVVRLAKYDDVEGKQYAPDQLTHTKPEPPDSWERIEEDADKETCEYFDHPKGMCSTCPVRDTVPCLKAKNKDIVRRCRALAEHDAS